MLDSVKVALRVNTNDPGIIGDIQDLIDAGELDLKLAGIYFNMPKNPDDKIDPLIKRAIVTYCKANYGYDNPDADRLNNSYVMLKQHLSLAGDYNVPLE